MANLIFGFIGILGASAIGVISVFFIAVKLNLLPGVEFKFSNKKVPTPKRLEVNLQGIPSHLFIDVVKSRAIQQHYFSSTKNIMFLTQTAIDLAVPVQPRIDFISFSDINKEVKKQAVTIGTKFNYSPELMAA